MVDLDWPELVWGPCAHPGEVLIVHLEMSQLTTFFQCWIEGAQGLSIYWVLTARTLKLISLFLQATRRVITWLISMLRLEHQWLKVINILKNPEFQNSKPVVDILNWIKVTKPWTSTLARWIFRNPCIENEGSCAGRVCLDSAFMFCEEHTWQPHKMRLLFLLMVQRGQCGAQLLRISHAFLLYARLQKGFAEESMT